MSGIKNGNNIFTPFLFIEKLFKSFAALKEWLKSGLKTKTMVLFSSILVSMILP